MSKIQKNQGKNAWFYVTMIILSLAIFILVIIFLNKNNPTLNNKNPSEKEIQINLVGSSQIKIINNPNETVLIDLVGSSNQITITKETKIYLIELVGSDNTFNLCKSHSPKIDETGSNNIINYLNC